jgi:Fic family protein
VGGERESKVSPPEDLTEEEVALLEAENALRQFDRLVDMIDGAVARERDGGGFRLTPDILSELNRLAVTGLQSDAGQIRDCGIEIIGSDHEPPPAEECEQLVEELCQYVNDNWESSTALHLAAYVMWRLNWVHPFSDGNGRTSRAASYLVLCARTATLLPGEKTIPHRIAEDRQPYYEALDDADAAWKSGELDLGTMEALLEAYLAAQLSDVYVAAGGGD